MLTLGRLPKAAALTTGHLVQGLLHLWSRLPALADQPCLLPQLLLPGVRS